MDSVSRRVGVQPHSLQSRSSSCRAGEGGQEEAKELGGAQDTSNEHANGLLFTGWDADNQTPQDASHDKHSSLNACSNGHRHGA